MGGRKLGLEGFWDDWLVFSPYLYGKRISWKVVWANQKWGWGRGKGGGSQVGM